jgi:hypothetical protein
VILSGAITVDGQVVVITVPVAVVVTEAVQLVYC